MSTADERGARGDALAAKLAELVAAEGSPRYWRFNDGRETAARSRVLYRLLAWVAEQGAARSVYSTIQTGPTRDDEPAPTMPATGGNPAPDAPTGAAPTTEPSEGAESVNRAHTEGPERLWLWRGQHWGPDADVLPYSAWPARDPNGGDVEYVRADLAPPAPDAALRAALDRAANALTEAENTMRAAEMWVAAARARGAAFVARNAALSPDAAGGDA